MSASARSSAAAAVVAELQSRHATEVRSYVRELWEGDDARAAKSLSAFWREWMPPPGVADEIPREYVFAGARRHVVAEQRGAGISVAETDSDDSVPAENADLSTRIAARFRGLTAKQQEMVRLHLRHRFDFDEMAEITELPAGSAVQLLHTALNRLSGGGADERSLQLALQGATGEQLAAESPETRNRVAELRLTIETVRQLLARGPDALRPRQRTARRRRKRWIAAAIGALALIAGLVFWFGRERTSAVAKGGETGRGQSRVSVQRVAGATPPHEMRSNAETANESSRASSPAPASKRRASFPNSHSDSSPSPNSAPASASATEPNASTSSVEHAALDPAANVTSDSAVASTARTSDAPTRAPAAIPRGQAGAVTREQSQPRDTAPTAEREPAATRLLADRVDTVPIAALRRALGATRWPARSEVNVAAMLGAIPPSVSPTRATKAAFTAEIEASDSPWHADRRLVRVALRARAHVATTRAPATVILLLDVSGSMDAPNRLPLVQTAVAGLLRRLQPHDRVGVVTYAGESRVLLPPAPLTDERAVRAAIDSLEAKGRTNGGAGLREAFRLATSDREAGGEHVVILCTDGDFNMGETSEAELRALIERHRAENVRLAIFGFGRADRIDARLEALAASARGGSGYVNTQAEAEQALVSQLDALFAPVAENLEATVEFDPTRVARFRILGDGDMRPVGAGAEVTFASRARVLPGEVLSAVFEIEPTAERARDTSEARVRAVCFAAEEPDRQTPYYGVWPGRIGRGTFAEASVDFRFAAATAAFAEALQAGAEAGAPRLDDIARWASGAIGGDAGGYRAELLAFIEQARRAARAEKRPSAR